MACNAASRALRYISDLRLVEFSIFCHIVDLRVLRSGKKGLAPC